MSRYSQKIHIRDFDGYVIKTQIAANTKYNVCLDCKFSPYCSDVKYVVSVKVGNDVLTKDFQSLDEALERYNSFIER